MQQDHTLENLFCYVDYNKYISKISIGTYSIKHNDKLSQVTLLALGLSLVADLRKKPSAHRKSWSLKCDL